jgi:hypothetical protein
MATYQNFDFDNSPRINAGIAGLTGGSQAPQVESALIWVPVGGDREAAYNPKTGRYEFRTKAAAPGGGITGAPTMPGTGVGGGEGVGGGGNDGRDPAGGQQPGGGGSIDLGDTARSVGKAVGTAIDSTLAGRAFNAIFGKPASSVLGLTATDAQVMDAVNAASAGYASADPMNGGIGNTMGAPAGTVGAGTPNAGTTGIAAGTTGMVDPAQAGALAAQNATNASYGDSREGDSNTGGGGFGTGADFGNADLGGFLAKGGPVGRPAPKGIAALAKGRFVRGPGDGVSDSVPASINGIQPARIADGEFIVPARIVSELGNGSSASGARKLQAMVNRIQAGRKKSTGKGRVAVDSKPDKHLLA